MPVSEKIVREAIQHLERGDHRRARTTLESGLREAVHGAWRIVADDGSLIVNKIWTKRHHAIASIRGGKAQFLCGYGWRKAGFLYVGEELIEAFLESPDGERTPVARIVREEIGDED